ncbi:unnamed protein product [Triticum turgidum subsp. durum]|uniref:Histidine-containing phosphotransfer protein n=1 Tax=Triticum turgidum subsp. durum TaxID=4567 RepID=A0A9R0V5L4_TRITD|nr:unnamed protein product [Triticum turgidum subsp. durum]
MAAAAIRAQINVLIATMFNTGLVDDAFLQLQRMREQGRVTPAYVVEVMNRFLNNAERIINDLIGLMNEPEVDFDKVDGLVQQLKLACSRWKPFPLYPPPPSLNCVYFFAASCAIQMCFPCQGVGAKRLNLCCVQHFSHEAKNKEGYLAALGRVRFQFYDLRSMFKIIMELEQHLAACGPK